MIGARERARKVGGDNKGRRGKGGREGREGRTAREEEHTPCRPWTQSPQRSVSSVFVSYRRSLQLTGGIVVVDVEEARKEGKSDMTKTNASPWGSACAR